MLKNNENDIDTHYDALLECLKALAKYYGRTISTNTLIASLPLINNKLTPALFIEAAKRIQLSCHLADVKLVDVTPSELPAVILLKDSAACVLTKIYDGKTGEFIVPQGTNDSIIAKLSLVEMNEKAIGITIYVKPTYHFEKRADEYDVEKPSSWFWETIWRYRYIYYQVALATFFINCFVIAAPLFVMNVYDRVVPNQTFPTLWALTIAIIMVYIFDLILKVIRGYLIDISSKKADIILSRELYKHLLELQYAAKPTSAGAFANNFHGFEAVRDFFTSATLVSAIDLPFIFLFILVIAYIGGWLAIIPLLAIPLVIGVSLTLEIPIRKAVEQSFIGEAQKQALLVESINRLETIKSSQSEGEHLRKWEYYTNTVARLTMKSRFYSALAVNFASYVLQMVYVVVIVAGVYAIDAKNLTLGGLIACSILSSRVLGPLIQIASLITRYHYAKVGLETLNHIMAMPSERIESQKFIYRPQISGNFEFDKVSFAYPHQRINVLNNISFKIKANEKVAILGRMGSGKSTLFRLIMGFYPDFSGSILIDDIDIHQLDPADIRRNIGFVPQDSGLFYGTLRDNICKSAPWASQEDLLKVVDVTGIAHYTTQNPSGFDLMIGEGGAGLSSGQQQSVAIARALLPNPPILLFDDVTSDMDDNSEGEFIGKLKDYIQDKTLIMITHKLSMLSLVDRIIILQNGQLRADGPKQDILKMLGN